MALPRQQTRTVAGVTYTLTRRRVRNINLRVRADGSVAASAAPRVSVMKVDAFVASKFLKNFGIPSVSAFMVLGPMMDLKNSILTLGLFKKKFATTLIITILLVVTAFSICLSFIKV